MLTSLRGRPRQLLPYRGFHHITDEKIMSIKFLKSYILSIFLYFFPKKEYALFSLYKF